MALFEEKKVEGGKFEPLKINELAKGESIAIYFGNLADRNSKEYGEFQVVEGLQVDLTSSSADELVKSAKPASFVPNTMLQNMNEQGGFVAGKLYRIVKKWERGEKFEDGKIAKGFGYEVFELKADGKTIASLKQAFVAAASGEEQVGAADKPKSGKVL